MIKLDITTRDYEADAKLTGYVRDKIGGLDKYLPRHVRGLVKGHIILEQDPNGREDNRLVCEAVISVGGTTLVCREGTLNMYAAVDIVEAKLKAQVRSYKDKHVDKARRPKLLQRFLRRELAATEQAATETVS